MKTIITIGFSSDPIRRAQQIRALQLQPEINDEVTFELFGYYPTIEDRDQLTQKIYRVLNRKTFAQRIGNKKRKITLEKTNKKKREKKINLLRELGDIVE